MKYKLNIKNYNDEESTILLHQLLVNRGITEPALWLNPTEADELSPFSFREIYKAIDLLKQTVERPESNIAVVVDSDLDGYTSGAIIISLLKMIATRQNVEYLLHPNKEHGIVLEDVSEDTDLLVVPDAGSSQKEEHLKLLENGTKIIILDHHEIDNDMDYGKYQNNIAIVSSQEANYENPALSGAGVALKFVQAYSSVNGLPMPEKLYALAACGIVADVMDMSYLENKQIVSKGIQYIKEHPFLYQLIMDSHYNIKNPMPSIKDIGWVISPNINAIIRLGTMAQKKVIFQALVNPLTVISSTKKGEEGQDIPIYEEACRFCKNAKKRQSTAVDKSIRIIEKNLQDSNDNMILYIDTDKELTFELSGLIANKLLSQYNKPVFLLRDYNNKGIEELRGSVRGKPVDGLDNLKELLTGVTGVEKAEGHAFAFGLELSKDLASEFRVHLNEKLSRVDYNSNVFLVDFISSATGVNLENAKIMAKDEIWCHGVEKPIGVIQDVNLDNYSVMGDKGQHLKIIQDQYDIILFNAPELTDRLSKGEKFNLEVVGDFSIDSSYNIGRLQFVAKDYNITPYKERTIWDVVF